MSPVELTWNEALSGIFGSISLASWIFLLVPQLIENYKGSSADGISVTFLLIWAAGDVLNLAGALWAGLVPTVIALAIYFCFADGILIMQCFYYNSLNARKAKKEQEAQAAAAASGSAAPPTETTGLLNGTPGSPKLKRAGSHSDNIGLPGSHRRSSAASHAKNPSSTYDRRDSLTRILEEPTNTSSWIKNTVSIFAILAVGAAGWAIAYKTGAWRPVPLHDGSQGTEKTPLGAEILGYGSAVLYLGARIPQIVKNQRERSCDGLSLLFFLLSLVGNATYGAGILFHSLERQYVLTNLPWLIGSLGTMAEDAIIFIQFSVFGEKELGGDEAVE